MTDAPRRNPDPAICLLCSARWDDGWDEPTTDRSLPRECFCPACQTMDRFQILLLEKLEHLHTELTLLRAYLTEDHEVEAEARAEAHHQSTLFAALLGQDPPPPPAPTEADGLDRVMGPRVRTKVLGPRVRTKKRS